MKKDKTSIYVDLYELRKILKRAQFVMSKADRIIYGTPVLKANADTLAAFVLAYEYELERRKDWMSDEEWSAVRKRCLEMKDEYIRRMIARFEVLKCDCRILVEDNVLKMTDRENARMKPESYRVAIFELIARIDESIGRWRASVRSRTTPKQDVVSESSH